MNETEQRYGGGAGRRQPRDRGEAHRHWDPLCDDCTDYAARLTAAGVAAITEAARSLGHSGRLPAAETVVA